MRKFTATVVASIVMGALAGCQSDPAKLRSQDEAGSVLLAVTMVAPWRDLKLHMSPDFTLSGESAVGKVAPITELASAHTKSLFDATLGLGLTSNPTHPATAPDVTSKGQGDGQQANPGTQQSSEATQNPNGNNKVQSEPVLDPMLLYKASDSLNQYVQLLNAEVDHVITSPDTVPYIVRLQLAFLPYRQDIPYDLHTVISFFMDIRDNKNGSYDFAKMMPTEGVTAVPLLVTDDIEKATMEIGSETTQKLVLAINALAAKAGANANFSDMAQAINSVSGQAINSRITVSRETQNTIYARIGAGYEATKKFALVGQTYDIFVLLLVPRERDASVRVRIISNTEFRNTDDGTVLKPRAPGALLDSADALMSNIFALDDFHLGKWNNASAGKKKELVQNLAGDIQANDYRGFIKDLCGDDTVLCSAHDSPKRRPDVIRYWRSVWAALSRLVGDSQFKSAIVSLPPPTHYEIPNQTGVLEEAADGVTSRVTLGNIVGDPTHCISATLVIAGKGQPDIRLATQHIATDVAEGTVALTFESMKALHASIGANPVAVLEIRKRTEIVGNADLATDGAGAHDPDAVPFLPQQQAKQAATGKSLAVCSEDSVVLQSYPVVLAEASATKKPSTAKGEKK